MSEMTEPDYARIAEWLGFTKSRGTNVWKRPEIVRLYSEADLRDFIDSPDGAFAILAKMRTETEERRERFEAILILKCDGKLSDMTPELVAESWLEAIP